MTRQPRRAPTIRSPASAAVLLAPLLLAAACGGDPDAGDVEAGPPAPEGDRPATLAVDSGFVPSGEARIFYEAMGDGPPVLVLHGGPALEHGYLVPGLRPLARDLRLVFYDQRGSGRSVAALDSATITLDGFLADVDAVADSLGHERFGLVGHSWGGLLAVLYASSRPERVDRLVLLGTIEPGSRYAAETAERQAGRQSPADSAAMAELIRSDAFRNREPDAVSRLYRLSFRSTFAEPDSAASLPLEVTRRTAWAAGTLPALLLGPVSPYDYWDRLERITAPTLVIHGDRDPIPPEMAREVADRVPDARVLVVERAGHFPFVERPDTVLPAIRDFFTGDER